MVTWRAICIIRHQPTQRPDLGGKEVRRDQPVEMRTDKLLPRGGRLALWSWCHPIALEDVTHGLVTDGEPMVGQGADDPVVALGAILLCQTNDQRLQLLVDPRTPWGLALWRPVKLLGHALTVPAENRVRLDEGGHFR
jgi:hypothetical protein